MPISINYDAQKNVLYSKAEGVITLDDIFSYYSSVDALELKPGYVVLADYSKAQLDLSYQQIAEMAKRRKSMAADSTERVKIAAFGHHDVVYGLGRTYQALLDEDKYEVGIFRNLEEAEKWLGI